MLPGFPSASPPELGMAVVPSGQYPEVYQPVRCSVCCQHAFGMNYGVPSCNACKMFFRRVIIMRPEYKCRGNDLCFRNIESMINRPKCRSCRFKRCLDVGMRYRASDAREDQEMLMMMSRSNDQARGGGAEQQPNVFVTPMDKLCSMLQSLLVLDSHRFECLKRMRSDEDPTIRDLINRSVRGFFADQMGQDCTALVPLNKQYLSQWSFFGIWTSIEFLNSLDFMSLLTPEDRQIMLKSYAMNAYLLSFAFQSTTRKFNLMVNPDGSEMLCDSVRQMFIPSIRVDRIQRKLVTKLVELQITPEEYILVSTILFCTPSTDELSEFAREIVSEQQKKYCKALMDYCKLTRNEMGPIRYQNIVSVGTVLAQCFDDVQTLVNLLKVFHPNAHNSKKLFVESLNK